MHNTDQVCQYFPQIIQAAQMHPLMLQHTVIEFQVHPHRKINLWTQDSEDHRCTDPVHVTYALLSGETFRQTAFHSYIRKNKIREKAGNSCQPQAFNCKYYPQKGSRCEKCGCRAGGLCSRHRELVRSHFGIRTLHGHRICSGRLF